MSNETVYKKFEIFKLYSISEIANLQSECNFLKIRNERFLYKRLSTVCKFKKIFITKDEFRSVSDEWRDILHIVIIYSWNSWSPGTLARKEKWKTCESTRIRIIPKFWREDELFSAAIREFILFFARYCQQNWKERQATRYITIRKSHNKTCFNKSYPVILREPLLSRLRAECAIEKNTDIFTSFYANYPPSVFTSAFRVIILDFKVQNKRQRTRRTLFWGERGKLHGNDDFRNLNRAAMFSKQRPHLLSLSLLPLSLSQSLELSTSVLHSKK